MGDVWQVSGFDQQRPRRDCFALSVGGEGNVGPAGEDILEVPGALPVPKQDQSRCHLRSVRSRGAARKSVERVGGCRRLLFGCYAALAACPVPRDQADLTVASLLGCQAGVLKPAQRC